MTIFYNILEQAWFNYILTALGIGMAGLITWLFATLQVWLSAKIKNEKIKQVSNLVLDLVRDSVLYVSQTFVDQLKKDGKFDEVAQKESFERALKRIKDNLTEESTKLLTELYGDIDKWLGTQIESIVRMNKPIALGE
jgi:hypothetical protein